MFEIQCPKCCSSNVRFRQTYKTKNNGRRKLFVCRGCQAAFSETVRTPSARIVAPLSRVSQVLTARVEGIGFNACCRTFKVGKETLRRWEERFASAKAPLLLYSLCHTFIAQTIEGDELYTKVGKNRAPKDSEGWTVILMERASRFIWHMECGKPDKRLFKKAIETLAKVIDQSESVTLITDGERRYGNLLFDICSELIKTGLRGRPKKLLKQA